MLASSLDQRGKKSPGKWLAPGFILLLLVVLVWSYVIPGFKSEPATSLSTLHAFSSSTASSPLGTSAKVISANFTSGVLWLRTVNNGTATVTSVRLSGVCGASFQSCTPISSDPLAWVLLPGALADLPIPSYCGEPYFVCGNVEAIPGEDYRVQVTFNFATGNSVVVPVMAMVAPGSNDDIVARGGSYFTNITATLSFSNFVGENDSLAGSNKFSVQLNSNTYDQHAWLQVVMYFNWDGIVRCAASGTLCSLWNADLRVVYVWLVGPPPVGCPTGWTSSDNHFFCFVGYAHVGIELGAASAQGPQLYPNGSLRASVEFIADGTSRLSLAYLEKGHIVQSANSTAVPVFNPYGQITGIESTIVGLGAHSHATFGNGTKLTMQVRPITNAGDVFGKDWEYIQAQIHCGCSVPGAVEDFSRSLPLSTAETSNLSVMAVPSENEITFTFHYP